MRDPHDMRRTEMDRKQQRTMLRADSSRRRRDTAASAGRSVRHVVPCGA